LDVLADYLGGKGVAPMRFEAVTQATRQSFQVDAVCRGVESVAGHGA
jgi:hypothetical protein